MNTATSTLDHPERKKEKKLDREHWMCRIQMFAFGIDAPTFYMGYCPFFWMTWAAVLVAPLVFILNILAKPTVYIFKKLEGKTTELKTISRRSYESKPLVPNWQQLLALDDRSDHRSEITKYSLVWDNIVKRLSDGVRLMLWLEANPDWRNTHLPAAQAYREKLNEDFRQEQIAKKARDVSFRKLSRTVSFCGNIFFKCLIPAAILAGAVFIYMLLAKIVTSIIAIGLLGMLHGFIILTAVAATFLAIYLGFDFIKILLEHRRANVVSYPTKEEKDGIFMRVGEALVKGLMTAVGFVKETISMTYKAECPLIIWGDETGSIVKRAK